MTELAASSIPVGMQCLSTRHYEAGPPAELVEPGETFATTREEEWISKKKTELLTTKQLETRVKRQVVLEDGCVVEDSGPVVTTNTSEDTEKQEHHQTELRKLGGDETDDANGKLENSSGWVVSPNRDGVVREIKECRVVSREETEETKEMEDIQHFGNVTDEDYLAVVNSGQKDLRAPLRDSARAVVSTGPRLVHESTKRHKVTDTENTEEVSALRPDGKIVTESKRTTEREIVDDDELPENQPDVNKHVENSHRYRKTRDQEEVEYLADGVKVGHEMRFKAETMEGERRGDDAEWDSHSARFKKAYHIRRPDLGESASPLDRKDALTKRPIDFDREEETRKNETSKWLENHFGSESRSSKNSLDEEEPPKTSFFNVTIKSQPVKSEYVGSKVQMGTSRTSPKLASPSREVERDTRNGYFQGVSDWAERRHEEFRTAHSNGYHSPYSPVRAERIPSPVQTYRYASEPRATPTPTPPERKRAAERRQRIAQSSRYEAEIPPPILEPPPDYSPPPHSQSPSSSSPKKSYQKTRFSESPPASQKPAQKQSSSNIIGHSIRKLVGKIRSASAERKSKQRAKRSPSPQATYQPYSSVDNLPPKRSPSPVQRYYLGEDPFAGSIYGRENKYDSVRPLRPRKHDRVYRVDSGTGEEIRSHSSTLNRFSKSTSALNSNRNAQTLPRNIHSERSKHHHYQQQQQHQHPEKTVNTINVSIINNQRSLANGAAPPKPARTYRPTLARSKSFNVHMADIGPEMHRNSPLLNRLDENPTGLKSPGIVSNISRSQRDLTIENAEEWLYPSRGTRSELHTTNNNNSKKVYHKGLKERSQSDYHSYTPTYKTATASNHHHDRYEPPTRLRASPQPTQVAIRRGSKDDYNEVYHTTSTNDDPLRPTVTNTMQSFSKKTVPSSDGRSLQTIESSETKSVTKSRFRGTPEAAEGGVVVNVKAN